MMRSSTIACTIALVWAWLHVVQARCPNWCNKRGECTSPSDGGYCVCHYGFTGEDCSQRLCPAGFDPMDLELKPNRRTIRMEVGHMGGIMMGKYQFSFAGSDVYLPANANDNDETKCNSVLKGLASVKEASCKRESFNADTGTGTYLISLLSFPDKPHMNNLVHHNGNPGINLFACNTSKIDAEEAQQPFCFLSDAEPYGDFPLYAECGNHGECDRVNGLCECARGFKGDNCVDMRDAEDIYEHIHDGPYFTASVVKIHAQRTSSAEFNLLQAQVDGQNVTTIRGDRLLQHEGDVAVTGALTLGASEGQASAAKIHTIIRDEDEGTEAAGLHLLAYHNNERVFSVSAEGDAHIAGTLAVGNASLSVEPHLVTAHNLRLQNDLHVQGSANVEESLTIGAGFALTPGGMTVDVASHSGTLFELRSRQQGFNGTLMELNSVGDNNVLIKTVSSGLTTFELLSSGVVKMNGLRLASGGVHVQAGGLQVDAGGMTVQGGLTIQSGGLHLAQQPFAVGSLQATAGEENLRRPLIWATTTSPHYSGDLLSLTATTADKQEPSLLSFLNLQRAPAAGTGMPQSVFRIRGDGQLESASGAVFRGEAGIEVQGATNLKGKVNLEKAALTPVFAEGRWQVTIPVTVTYAVIGATARGAGKDGAVEVRFDRGSADTLVTAGRIVVLSNADEQTTSGEAAVPPSSTVLMLYDGHSWVSVDALRAPMHELKLVRSLEAANDLHIGNHTLTALRFQATGLRKHALVFASAEGYLADSEKLTYTKGVLSTPALRAEKVVGDIDMRGNDISNAQLTNPKITGATLSAAEISVPGSTGLAYFNQKGTLTAATSLSLDDAGRLLITDTYADINAHGHYLRNLTLRDANLTDIGSIRTGALYLTGADVDTQGGLLMTREGGRVVSAQGAIAINPDTGNVAVKTLSAGALSGPLDAHHHTIANAALQGGSAKDLTVLSAEQATFTSLRGEPGAAGAAPRFVFADAQGTLHAAASANTMVTIPQLTVQDLHFLSPEVDFQGRKVKNIVLDSDTFVLGPQKQLQAEEVLVTRLDASLAQGALLSADSKGKLGALAGVTFADGVLDVATSTISAAAVRSQSLTLSATKGAAALMTGLSGEVVGTAVLDLDKVTAKQGVTITSAGGLELQGREAHTLLAVGAKGEVVTVPRPARKSDAAQQASTNVDVSLRDVQSATVSTTSLSASKVVVEELHLTGSAAGSAGAAAGAAEATYSGSVLVQGKAGRISALSDDTLRVEKGVIHASSLQPASLTAPLLVTTALISQSNVSASHIHNAVSISTATLSVREQAEFLSDVVIDGSVTVHGTVVGSGPYVDSSDARLKRNISTITHALDTVEKLRGVTYNFRTEEFSDRGLPSTPQLGFVAQEVQAVLPQLVTTDAEGFQGVAYAHVTALLTEAVKELKAKHETEVTALRGEVAELRKLVQMLLLERQEGRVEE